MKEGAGDTVVLGKLVIDFGGEVVFESDLLPRERENSDVAISKGASVRYGVVGVKESRHGRIHLHRSYGKQPLPRSDRRHGIHVSHAQRLPQALIIAEEERSALLDWPSERSSELIPLEGRNLRVKKIARVESAVTEEFVSIAVEPICPG